MNLQNIIDMAKDIESLRTARDLLREVQWENNSNKIIPDKNLKDKINDYFNYDSERENETY